jgi:CelD/BcsL family acetyltransferase involved in cellulose biosynthesis
MNQFVTLETFDALLEDWEKLQSNSNSHIFSTYQWSQVWWQQFGNDYSLSLEVMREQGAPVGIAPLRNKNGVASFVGSQDICDYLDFVVVPGYEDRFSGALLEKLISSGIHTIDLVPVRTDSVVYTSLQKIASQRGFRTTCEQTDISLDMPLPSTWDDYLKHLTGKQRHELKRKVRRLNEMGNMAYRTSTDVNAQELETFLELFRNSRNDKADFLTPEMELFFKSIVEAMAGAGFLRLNFMELDGKPVAATLCFDYRNCMYLYNSGYDPEYGWLSAGLLSKALCIQDSISQGKERFDFLKGDEVYKYHLGGQELPLHKCTISLLK